MTAAICNNCAIFEIGTAPFRLKAAMTLHEFPLLLQLKGAAAIVVLVVAVEGETLVISNE
jgi:hypothetical protein